MERLILFFSFLYVAFSKIQEEMLKELYGVHMFRGDKGNGFMFVCGDGGDKLYGRYGRSINNINYTMGFLIGTFNPQITRIEFEWYDYKGMYGSGLFALLEPLGSGMLGNFYINPLNTNIEDGYKYTWNTKKVDSNENKDECVIDFSTESSDLEGNWYTNGNMEAFAICTDKEIYFGSNRFFSSNFGPTKYGEKSRIISGIQSRENFKVLVGSSTYKIHGGVLHVKTKDNKLTTYIYSEYDLESERKFVASRGSGIPTAKHCQVIPDTRDSNADARESKGLFKVTQSSKGTKGLPMGNLNAVSFSERFYAMLSDEYENPLRMMIGEQYFYQYNNPSNPDPVPGVFRFEGYWYEVQEKYEKSYGKFDLVVDTNKSPDLTTITFKNKIEEIEETLNATRTSTMTTLFHSFVPDQSEYEYPNEASIVEGSFYNSEYQETKDQYGLNICKKDDNDEIFGKFKGEKITVFGKPFPKSIFIKQNTFFIEVFEENETTQIFNKKNEQLGFKIRKDMLLLLKGQSLGSSCSILAEKEGFERYMCESDVNPQSDPETNPNTSSGSLMLSTGLIIVIAIVITALIFLISTVIIFIVILIKRKKAKENVSNSDLIDIKVEDKHSIEMNVNQNVPRTQISDFQNDQYGNEIEYQQKQSTKNNEKDESMNSPSVPSFIAPEINEILPYGN